MKLYYYASGDEATAILERGFQDVVYRHDPFDPEKETPAVYLSESAPQKSDHWSGAVLEVALSFSEEELHGHAALDKSHGRRAWFIPAALLNTHAQTRIIAVQGRVWEERHAGRIIVDPEFAALIPPLSYEEDSALGHSISMHGCRDALVVWPTPEGDILLDGHNRYRHCCSHEKPFAVVAAPGVHSRDAAMRWMIDNQLARRNITPEQRTFLMGMRYNQSKISAGFRGNQHTRALHQNDGEQVAESGSTALRLAQQYKVSVPTIERAGQFATAVETLTHSVGPEVKETLLSGTHTLTQQAVVALAQAAPADQKRVLSLSTDAEIKAAAREIAEREKAERAQVRANASILHENRDETDKKNIAAYADYKRMNKFSHSIWCLHRYVEIEPRRMVDHAVAAGLLGFGGGELEKSAVDAVVVWLQDYSRTLGTMLGPRFWPEGAEEPRRLLAVPPLPDDEAHDASDRAGE